MGDAELAGVLPVEVAALLKTVLIPSSCSAASKWKSTGPRLLLQLLTQPVSDRACSRTSISV